MNNFEKIVKRLLDGEKPLTVHEMLYKLNVKLQDDPKVMRSIELALADCNVPVSEKFTEKWLMFKVLCVEWYYGRQMPKADEVAARAQRYIQQLPWTKWRDNIEVSEEDKSKADLEQQVYKLVLESPDKTAKDIAENIAIATNTKFPQVYSLVLKARRNLKQSTKEVVKEVGKRGRRGSRRG